MTDFAVRRADGVLPDDKTWAASSHAFNTARSGTLDLTTLTAEDHYPNGYVPSGTVLAFNDATDLWEAVDGVTNTEADGILYEAVDVRTGQERTTIAVLDHLIVYGARLRGATLPVTFSAASAVVVR